MLAFFNHPFFTVIGSLTTILAILTAIYALVCWIIGITPVVFRIGYALWKREIAVFSSQEQFNVIKTMLLDSKIFSEKNIVNINKGNIEKAKKFTIFLIEWETFSDKINEIFMSRVSEQTSIVIYAKPGSIPQNQMADIANRTNVIVVNFKGRLLNDILISMITSSYNSKVSK